MIKQAQFGSPDITKREADTINKTLQRERGKRGIQTNKSENTGEVNTLG